MKSVTLLVLNEQKFLQMVKTKLPISQRNCNPNLRNSRKKKKKRNKKRTNNSKPHNHVNLSNSKLQKQPPTTQLATITALAPSRNFESGDRRKKNHNTPVIQSFTKRKKNHFK